MRIDRLVPLIGLVLGFSPQPVAAQADSPPDGTRAALVAAQQAEKAADLRPYGLGPGEAILRKVEERFISGTLHWHPFFNSAYPGGGFTLGAGYLTYVSPYNTVDVRGSITISGYKRIESEFRMPRLFRRRGTLSVLGGWREATQVGFFGIGNGSSKEARTNFSFRQPYVGAQLLVRPSRGAFELGAGIEYSQWKQVSGRGAYPSVESIYTPEELPGLNSSPTYLHSNVTAAFDWRPGADYARRGGYYGVTLHDYWDREGTYSFRQVDYEAVQHIPIFRDAWVLSLRGRAQLTTSGDDQVIPFFMLPALGSGSTLRGYASWRFRDRHSILLSAEWRILVNAFLDTAVFYDAGKVTSSRHDVNLKNLQDNFGIGLRIHGPATTPIRIEIARGDEGLRLVFAASSAF